MRALAALPIPRARVLLVDRHGDTLEMYGQHLRQQGFSVLCCASADDALEAARLIHPDVVSTEWGLRCTDGAEFCEALRGDGRTRDIPLIVVTTWLAPDRLAGIQRLGCAAVLLKPVLPGVLADHVRQAVGERGASP